MSNNSGFVGSGVCGVKQTPDYKKKKKEENEDE